MADFVGVNGDYADRIKCKDGRVCIMPDAIPEYDREYTMGEAPVWDLPENVVATAENETKVKIALIDQRQVQTVHADKEALREKSWDSAEEFREDVDWDVY